MKCPHCERDFKGLILETRQDGESVYRRRVCPHCSKSVVSKEVFSADFRLPPTQRERSRLSQADMQINRDIFKNRWF